jgi:uncharacterized protein YhaN
MRITRLEMDNFGPFNGRQVDGFSPGLTVVHGENEAGKSALRAFMRVVLFGFPRRRTEDHDDYYYEPALPGGAAGSVHIEDSSGDPYVIHRAEGVRGGPVAISGTRDGGEDLLRELIGGVDDAFYQNVFSISLTELQSFEDLGRGEITERIYSAGLGIGNISLREVTRRLDERISKFRRVRSGSLFDLEKDLRQAREQLNERRSELAGYDHLSDELRILENTAEELNGQLTILRANATRVQRLLEIRGPWLIHRRLQAELQELPADNAIPADGIDRLDSFERDSLGEESQISEGDRVDRERERQASDLPVIEAFALRENDVRRAISRIDYYQRAVQDSPRREAEADEIENGVARDLDAIGLNWTIQRAGDFNEAAGTIALIQATADSRADASRTASKALDDLNTADVEVKETAEELRLANSRLQAAPEAPTETLEELEHKLGRLNTLEGALAELDSSHSSRAPASSSQSFSGTKLPGSVLVLAGLIGIAWAFATSEITGAVIGIVAVIAGAAFAIKYGTQKTAVTGERAAPPDVAAEVASIARELDLSTPLSARDVVEARNAVGRAISRKSDSAALTEVADNASAASVNAEVHRKDSSDLIERSNADMLTAEKEWTDLLARLNLHPHFERDDALGAINNLGVLSERAQEATRLRERVAGMQTQNAETDDLLGSIYSDAGLEHAGTGEGLVALHELERLWEAHVRGVDRRQALKRESAGWKDAREGLIQALNKSKDGITGLLEGAGCENPEAFRGLATQSEIRRALEGELEAIKRTAPDLFGERAFEIDSALEQSEPEQLQAELQALQEKVTQTGEERDAAVGQAGEVKAALKQMETEAEVARLHSRIDELTEQLREDARQWSVLTVARSLLDQTREEFQEQRQPSLLLAASRYFNRMTLGRYASVRAVIGEERFEVVTGDGRPVPPERLSRGAAEQLWLSIRFALVDEYGSGSQLPVILDDLLVNFDPQRARAACSAISALSERQQVIFLTCQPSTVSMLEEAMGANPAAIMSLINLDNAGNQRVDEQFKATHEDPKSHPAGAETSTVAPSVPPETARPRMQPLL